MSGESDMIIAGILKNGNNLVTVCSYAVNSNNMII